jgi:hypothetical protein
MFDKTSNHAGLKRPASATVWSLPVACALALVLHSPVQAEVSIVVHAGTTASLDEAYVAKLFLRQVKTFPDGTTAAPVNQKEGPVSDEFRATVLKKNAAQFRSYWAQQMFTGGAKPLPEVSDDDAVLKHVAETPGGIGYVEAGKTRAGVRVLKK